MNIKKLSLTFIPTLLASALSSAALAGYPVNINAAAAPELADALDGVGLSKAEAIVSYRDINGPFLNKESLTSVRGIGEATLEKNRDYILLDSPKPNMD